MGLRENIQHDTIGDLALRKAVVVQPDITIREAIKAMQQAGLGAVIVVDEDGKPVGMYNEKMLPGMLSTNPGAMDRPVRDHMTSYVICLRKSESIATLIATMEKHKLRWVCVVDDAGRPVALTGLRGVVEYLVEYFPYKVKMQPLQSRLAIEQREGA
ncbi:MAG: CBS domain-containing protein [Phycisphaera sp.]|nr:CBS domain-containing protein [Phycisphaera sp.]